jgi:O-methyltransferase
MRSLETLHTSYVLTQRARWEAYRRVHPRLWRALAWLNRCYRASRQVRYHRLYERFRADTMLPRSVYVHTLELVDLYRHLDGTVVECGVWKGGMAAGLATLLGPSRAYYLYDSFAGLPPATALDGEAALRWQREKASPKAQTNLAVDRSFAEAAMQRSGAHEVHIIPGWFRDTLPHYAGSPIAVLRIDGDWYESTMDCLTSLYPQVVQGGLILLDDYYYWEGCTRAVHDFLSKNGLPDRLRQFHDNIAYMVRP